MTVHAKPPAAGEALPEWRLEDLFSGRDDPRVEWVIADGGDWLTAAVTREDR